jgi:sugar-specific transcriptional regulator TrmB
MSIRTDNVFSLIKPLGLNSQEVEVYLFLLKNSEQTALSLSRKLHIGRTKVYRILDKLVKKNIILEKLGSRGLQFEAAHPQSLEQLVADKEIKAKTARESLSTVVSQLELLMPNQVKKSKVLYYEGLEGLKQVSYNTTRANGVLRVFEVSHLGDFLDEDFSEQIRKEYLRKKIITRDLTNQKSFKSFSKNKEFIKKCSEFRFIDKKDLEIKFETLIYNDVYVTYTYQGNEVFCIEVYNQQLADMQKQLFDFIWKKAVKMRFIDEFGGASII